MISLIKRTLILAPIALFALGGAAVAATSGGGGGGGGNGGGGSGQGSGGSELPTCLTGAYCPPGKQGDDPAGKLPGPVAKGGPADFNPQLPGPDPQFLPEPPKPPKPQLPKKPVVVKKKVGPVVADGCEATPVVGTGYDNTTRCAPVAAH